MTLTASQASLSRSEDLNCRRSIPVAIVSNAGEDLYHESRTEGQTQNTGSGLF